MKWWGKFIKWQYEAIFRDELKKLSEDIEVLKTALKKEKVLNKPLEKGIINIFETNVLFKKAFPDAEIYLSDPTFTLTSVTEAEKFLKQDLLNFEKFEKDVNDCDDFSRELWTYWRDWQSSLALGILWISKPYPHALNVAILTDEEGLGVYIIEPQTDKISKVPKDYKGRLIVM